MNRFLDNLCKIHNNDELLFLSFLEFKFILRGKGGNLASPNYPRNYPLNVSCIWTIIPPEDKLVEIDFVDFDLEKNKRCRYDYMQIREFSGPTGIFVKRISSKFCGNRLPEKYISLPRTRTEIRFVSDPYSEVAKGFRALWRLIPLSSGSAERPLSSSRSTSRPTTSKTSTRTSTTSATTLKSSGPTTGNYFQSNSNIFLTVLNQLVYLGFTFTPCTLSLRIQGTGSG